MPVSRPGLFSALQKDTQVLQNRARFLEEGESTTSDRRAKEKVSQEASTGSAAEITWDPEWDRDDHPEFGIVDQKPVDFGRDVPWYRRTLNHRDNLPEESEKPAFAEPGLEAQLQEVVAERDALRATVKDLQKTKQAAEGLPEPATMNSTNSAVNAADIIGLLVPDDTTEDKTRTIKARQLSQHRRNYEVVHDRVAVRSRPSTAGRALAVIRRGLTIKALPFSILDLDGDGAVWLHLTSDVVLQFGAAGLPDVKEFGGWLLMDGEKLGLGELVRETQKPINKGDGKKTCMVCGKSCFSTKDKALHEKTEGHSGFLFGGG